jgi:integrase
VNAAAKVLKFPNTYHFSPANEGAKKEAAPVAFLVNPLPPMPPKPRILRPWKPPVSLREGQLVAFFRALKDACERNYVMCLIMWWHGLRSSEVADLRMGDIDLEAGTIRIRRGKGSNGGLHPLMYWEDNPLFDERVAITNWLANWGQFGVKGGAKRGARRRPRRAEGGRETRPGSALLPSDAGCDLRQVQSIEEKIVAEKRRQSTEIVSFSPNEPPPDAFVGLAYATDELLAEARLGKKPAAGPRTQPDPLTSLSVAPCSGKLRSPKPDDRLFPIRRQHVWRIAHRYMLAVGIPAYKCKAHTLKHTIAKHLVRRGVPLNAVQAWMGWRSIGTMDHYTRDDEEQLGQRIGDAVRGSPGLLALRQGSLF